MRPALGLLLAIAAAAIAIVLWPRESKNSPRPTTPAERDPRPAHPLDGDADRVRVYGTVTANGKPLAGATVQLHDNLKARNPPMARVTTAADGSFDLGENNLGEWTIVAHARGHQAVAVGAQRSPLRVALPPCKYPLRGHIRDTAGAAVRGAYLVQPNPDRLWMADERGAYEVCVDPLAPYFAVAAPHHEGSSLSPRPADHEVDIVLRRLGTLMGRVVRDDTGAPLEGVSFTYYASTTTTAADGTFRIDDVHIAPRQRVWGDKDDWRVESDWFEVRPGETVTLTLRARRRFRVRGAVLEGDGRPVESSWVCFANDCAQLDENGRFELLAGEPGEKTVSMHDRLGVTPSRVVVTPGMAELVIRAGPLRPPPPPPHREPPPRYVRVTRLGVPVVGADMMAGESWIGRSGEDGLFTATYSEPSHAISRELLAASRNGRMAADGLLTFELEDAAAIGGIVVDHRGDPVGHVAVRVHDRTANFAAVAYNRRDGSFYVGALPAGTYDVEVYRGDALPFVLEPVAPIHVATSDTIVTQVRLVVDARTGAVAGRVVDASGAPIAGAVLFLAPRPHGIPCDGWEAERGPHSDVDGRFRIADLPLGATIALFAVTCDGRRGEVRARVGDEDVALLVAKPN